MSVSKKEYKRVTVKSLIEMKSLGEKISMLTAYDYTMAKIVDGAGVDVILVGDSASNVMAGHETTLPITLDHMIYHASSVVRAIDRALVVVDLPFGTYQSDSKEALRSAIRIMKESGGHAVKLEGGKEIKDSIKKILNAGIPVMGHLGLTPQSVHSFGGWKLQGKTKEKADIIETDAKKLEDVGVFSLVLEMIPNQLSTKITKKLNIPTIGIGAGPGTSGQVLVLQDILGLSKDFNPTFARKYVDGYKIISEALNKFDGDVKIGDFPKKDETF